MRRNILHMGVKKPTHPLALTASPHRQSGVAIIMAMLVIALGTITMVSIASRQQLDTQRERNEGLIQQARNFGISGERFAAALLFRDVQAELRSNSDSLDDDWAQTIPPVPIDNASIKGCIIDMQGRLNVNNLVDEQGAPSALHRDQFVRLFQELSIEPTKIDAVIDWLDANVEATGAEGAEDDYYTSLDVPYRAANAELVSVSELQLIKGFSSAVEEQRLDYELLLPHIAVLPKSAGTTLINVNTATPEVLAAIDERLKEKAAELTRWDTLAYEDYPECENIFDLEAEETLDSERDTTPFEEPAEFLLETAIPPEEQDGIGEAITVRSNWYQVRIDVGTEGITLSQFTLFERLDNGQTRIVSRSRDTL